MWRRRGEREAEGDNPRVAISFCNYRGGKTITLRSCISIQCQEKVQLLEVVVVEEVWKGR